MSRYTRTNNFPAGQKARGSIVQAELDAIQQWSEDMPDSDDVQSGSVNFVAAGGTANAITVAAPGTWTTYAGKDGYRLTLKIAADNSGAVTLNVDSLGAKSCVRNDGSALVAADLKQHGIFDFSYNESQEKFYVAAFNGLLIATAASAAAAASSASAASSSASAASSYASSASGSEAAAAASESAAQADAVATAADRVQTGLDVASIAGSEAATAADRVQTGLDAVATAADRVQTGLDAVATAADAVSTAADAVATAADAISTAADAAAADADRILAEAAAVSAVNNALAAAASASSIADYSARVQAILKTRGILNVMAVAFFSNGGAGQKVQASYVTETRPTGRFLGDHASATAAWAANVDGIATVAGDYYWSTTTPGQLECTTLNNSTTILRGAQNYLPSEGVAVAWRSNSGVEVLSIFDLTDPLVPMWMQFNAVASTLWAGTSGTPSFTEVTLRWDGLKLYAARNAGTGENLLLIDFEKDEAIFWASSAMFTFAGKILNRGSANGYKFVNTTSTLDSNAAGLDFAKGFVAFSNDGGVGVIAKDSTIPIKSSSTTAYPKVAIHRERLYALRTNVTPDVIYDFGDVKTLAASFSSVNTYDNTGYPYLGNSAVNGCDSTLDFLTIRNSVVGIDLLWPNPSTKADGLLARKGLAYATPPMKKPTLMVACSTATGALSTANLVTNGDFPTDIASWSLVTGSGGTIAWDAGQMLVDRTSAAVTGGTQAISIAEGETLTLTVVATWISGASATARLAFAVDGTTSGTILASDSTAAGVSETLTVSYTATSAATVYVQIGVTSANGQYKFDDVSAKRAIRDHSGISNHGAVNGSLTATAEVTGGVALISGFTVNTNYLSAPNAWTGVGTSDAWLCGVVKCAASVVDERILGIGYWDGSASLNAGVAVAITSAGVFQLYVSNDGGATSITAASSGTYDDGLLHTWLVRKATTHYYLEVDGYVVASVAVGSHGNLTFHASALATVGRTASGSSVAPNCSIALIGAGISSIAATEALLIHQHLRNLVMNKAALDEVPYRVAANVALGTVEMVGATYHQTMRDGAIVSSVAHGQGGSAPAIACGYRGEIGIGGSTGCSISVPERNLREAETTLTTERFTIKYEGDASRVNFPDPTSNSEMLAAKGAKPVRISNAGTIVDEGAAEAWLLKQDSFGWWAQFAVAPSSGNNITVEFEREIYK